MNSMVLTISSKLLRFSPSLVLHLFCFKYPTTAMRLPVFKYFSAISAVLLKQVHLIQLVLSFPELKARENDVTGLPSGPKMISGELPRFPVRVQTLSMMIPSFLDLNVRLLNKQMLLNALFAYE
jgi:hypothetical protein